MILKIERRFQLGTGAFLFPNFVVLVWAAASETSIMGNRKIISSQTELERVLRRSRGRAASSEGSQQRGEVWKLSRRLPTERVVQWTASGRMFEPALVLDIGRGEADDCCLEGRLQSATAPQFTWGSDAGGVRDFLSRGSPLLKTLFD